ncbi:uncharacterized protein LOC129972857 [Argiope bruennichi]|uniref:uncharacterized protein LOC129972857 n=1 Tax=Argiope bruennichi TaxID=94029 RepID=UPI002493D070|nr:uncharacterized protein LOC129972857 [Argiope bruennichi]
MNRIILSAFLAMLIVACVEGQQQEGEECGTMYRRRCRANQYCYRPNFMPLDISYCLTYRGRGMPCDEMFRCQPGLECTERSGGWFPMRRCQEPASTTTSTSMPETVATSSTAQ